MALFHVVEDCYAVLRRKGVFQQVRLYQRGDAIYAGVAANRFIRLMARSNTTDPNTLWDSIDDLGGRLTLADGRAPAPLLLAAPARGEAE